MNDKIERYDADASGLHGPYDEGALVLWADCRQALAAKDKELAETKRQLADTLSVMREAREWMTTAFHTTGSVMRDQYDIVMAKMSTVLCGKPVVDDHDRQLEQIKTHIGEHDEHGKTQER